MPERDFVEVVFACEFDQFCAALCAAPITVEFATFFQAAFYSNIFKIKWHLRILFSERLQKVSRCFVCKIALDVNRGKFAVR